MSLFQVNSSVSVDCRFLQPYKQYLCTTTKTSQLTSQWSEVSSLIIKWLVANKGLVLESNLKLCFLPETIDDSSIKARSKFFTIDVVELGINCFERYINTYHKK